MIKLNTTIPKILGNLYGFPKNLKKSGASEMFRWVPLSWTGVSEKNR